MKPPILIAGLPRTGTTWLGEVLGATTGTAYYFEPFNLKQLGETRSWWLRYLRASDEEPDFAAYCQKCFSGRQRHPRVMRFQSRWRRMLPFPTGRVLIKDVHSVLTLDWIHHHIAPRIVILLRHPFAMAESWHRMNKGEDVPLLDSLLGQRSLVEDYLQPFASHLRSAGKDFWSRTVLYSAACYHVALEQQRRHPEWIVIRHEDFLDDPLPRFRDLCAKLDLPWTAQAEERLKESNEKDSGKMFVAQRLLENEKDKWRRSLTAEQIKIMTDALAPFQMSGYTCAAWQPVKNCGGAL